MWVVRLTCNEQYAKEVAARKVAEARADAVDVENSKLLTMIDRQTGTITELQNELSKAIESLETLPANAVIAASSDGCGKPLPDKVHLDESVNLSLESDSGITPRKYRLHIPASYDTSSPVPLILSFHGRGKDAEYQEALSQFSNATYGFQGISVYPEGIPNTKGTQQWQGDPDAPASINDVTFTLELLDHIQSRYCIDTSRIYATGKSNGGGFTGVLACDATATTRIAAFAPVSGAFYLDANQQPMPCNPSRKPIPLIDFHGWHDKTIPYGGGINTRGNANSTSIVAYMDDWAKRDGFEVAANTTSYLCSGNMRVTRYSWDDVVIHYNYTNLEHDWPSSFPNGDTKNLLTCKEAEATSIILEWFTKWTL
ncbi:LpqC, Poly(3-hydroxybutyrate) depolymerase [Pyrenophora tritici-repentis]|uniref:feruloyl esterase n=1 Tax=Pyrenophora tritici-repentis TaxID=45151 RepID=A0A834VUW0_9PLEO|nr:LpqC Poly depolymerase [Pyrenophora tritici-repentis]KAF7576698.1 LpqC, Poly(3-hydroxybutyrate) depolymerase [Pyrenophora tritici-repentis]KAI0611872.1 LpqC Poly(3-hydroxybutyrate) depolymerase [Pyrenophora tritici-repentis]KAI1687725.1 Poly depolymerase [Pyrenophora tritici-repentis]PZD31283.1 LpqC, Poly(3-hydroxybutyrate) depolymerase [Pyrenophora tritici-repentis]